MLFYRHKLLRICVAELAILKIKPVVQAAYHENFYFVEIKLVPTLNHVGHTRLNKDTRSNTLMLYLILKELYPPQTVSFLLN